MTPNKLGRAASRLTAAGAAALAVLLGLGGLAWAAPKPEAGWGMPHDVSVDGWRIDKLFHVSTVFITLLFVIMVVWMLYAVFKHNAKHEARYDHGDSKKSVYTTLGLAASVFFIVDGNMLYNSIADLHEAFFAFEAVDAKPNVVRIEINAHQWAWDARYAGPDGKFNTPDDVVTLNDIRIPVGQPVILQITSTDVLHSFYLPNFRVKQDAVPGMVNRLTFQAKETGEFDIGCAQHCGVHHYKMKGQLTILPPADFQTWAAEASALSARGYDPTDQAAHWGWDWERRIKS